MANTTIQGSHVLWSDIKAFVDNYGLMLHYTENSRKYALRVNNGDHAYKTDLFKAGVSVGGSDFNQAQNDADLAEFEADYKADANGLDKTAIRIDSDEQIDVTVTGGTNTLSNKLRYATMTSNQSISTSSFTTVYTYTGSGTLYGLYLETTWSDMQLKVEVDGVDITSAIEMENIPIAGPGNSGNAGPGAPYINRLSDNEVSLIPPAGIKYTTSVVVKLKSANNNKKLANGFVTLTKVT